MINSASPSDVYSQVPKALEMYSLGKVGTWDETHDVIKLCQSTLSPLIEPNRALPEPVHRCGISDFC
jgi:hypothetical protein